MSSERTKAVILAGGKGTRLHPYTIVLPKPLVPVGDMPILEILIRQLAACGIRDLTVAVGHLAELIQSFFRNGEKWGVDIQYSIEDKPLSTIGPLRLIPGLGGDFFVMNGDLLTDIDFRDLMRFHRERQAALTVGCVPREVTIDFGVLRIDPDQRIVGFEEKPRMAYTVSMGVYALNERVLARIPEGRSYGFDHLIADLLAAGEPVAAYHHGGYWMDIGRPDDYQQAVADFEALRPQLLPDAERNGVPEREAGR
jgi:NDP-sugar pyrophosphorylase family protein